MPYVRCGKCVYKGEKCSTKGEKVGCSDSLEKAKKYLIKLRMETNEGVMKITKNKLIQLIKEELEVVLTDNEAKEMFDIDVSGQVELSEVDDPAATAAIPTLERVPTVAEPALQRPVWDSRQREALSKLAGNINKRFDEIEAQVDQLAAKLN